MNEKEIDFEHLTKEQTIYLHRKLWSSVAKLTHQLGRPVEKHEIFEIYGWPEISGYCWCCEYTKQNNKKEKSITACSLCPIKWGDGTGCFSIFSPYSQWYLNMCIYYGKDNLSDSKINEITDLASMIANLPEKE